MKEVFELLKKLKRGCPEIEGISPDISIEIFDLWVPKREGIFIEARWYLKDDRYTIRQVYTETEINSIPPELIIEAFIVRCNQLIENL